jgi:hypothetical protein
MVRQAAGNTKSNIWTLRDWGKPGSALKNKAITLNETTRFMLIS